MPGLDELLLSVKLPYKSKAADRERPEAERLHLVEMNEDTAIEDVLIDVFNRSERTRTLRIARRDGLELGRSDSGAPLHREAPRQRESHAGFESPSSTQVRVRFKQAKGTARRRAQISRLFAQSGATQPTSAD